MKKPSILIALFLLIAGACHADPVWETSPEAAYKKAADSGKPIMVLFTGPEWCGPCQYAEANIFNKPEFTKLIADEFVLLKWNVPNPRTPKGAKAAEAAYNQFGVQGYPTVILLAPDKKPLVTLMPTRYKPTPEAFVQEARVAYAHTATKTP